MSHQNLIMELLITSHRTKQTTLVSSAPASTTTMASTKHLLRWSSRRETTLLFNKMTITRLASTQHCETMPTWPRNTTKRRRLLSSSSMKRCRETLSCHTMNRIRWTKASGTQFRSTRRPTWARSNLRKRSETLSIHQLVIVSWLFRMSQLVIMITASRSRSPCLREDKDSSRLKTNSSRPVPWKTSTITMNPNSRKPSLNSNHSKKKTLTNTSKSWITRSSLVSPSPSKKRECEWTPLMGILRLGRCLKW